MRKTITLPGGTFSYLQSGADDMPLVVCLHGFPDHPAGFEALMGTLAEAGYRAVAPWMRGYAPSTTDGPYTVTRLTDDTRELIDALSPDEPVVIVGHDWGAAVAYSLAHRSPERLRCAITMALPHPLAFLDNLKRTPAQMIRSSYMALFQIPRLSEKLIWKDDLAYIDRLWSTWSPRYRLTAAYRARLKNCIAASMPAPIKYYRTLLTPATLREVRANGRDPISVPTLHLHGSEDGCVSKDMGHSQERYFSGPFASKTIPGAGHFLHLEAPERTVSHTLSWLRDHAQAT